MKKIHSLLSLAFLVLCEQASATTYPELKAAFDNAGPEGVTFALTSDVACNVSEPLVLKANCKLTLDLAGHRIEVKRDDAIQVRGEFTLVNSDTSRLFAHLFNGRIASAQSGAIVSCLGDGVFNMKGGLLASFPDLPVLLNPNNHYGRAIYACERAKVNLSGSAQVRGNPMLAINGNVEVNISGNGSFSGNGLTDKVWGKNILIEGGDPKITVTGGGFDCHGSLVESESGAKGTVVFDGACLESWHVPFVLHGATHVFLKRGWWGDTNIGKNDSAVLSLVDLGNGQALCTAYHGFCLYVKKTDCTAPVALASGCTIATEMEMKYWEDKKERPYNCYFSNPNGPSCLNGLQNAFKNASPNGSTYALTADVTLLPDMQLVLPAGCVLNLDLAGYRLEVTRGDAIRVYGSLNIQNESTKRMSTVSSLSRGRIASLCEGAIISCYDGSRLDVVGGLIGSFAEAIDLAGFVDVNTHFGTAVYAEQGSVVHFGGKAQGRGNPLLAIAGDATVSFDGGGYSGNPSSTESRGKCVYICSGNPTVAIRGGSFDCKGSLLQSDAGSNGSVAISGAKLQSWHTPFLLGGTTQVDLRDCCYTDTGFFHSQKPTVSRLAALDNPLSSCVVHPGVYAYLGSIEVLAPFVESGSDINVISGSWNGVPVNCAVAKSQMLSSLEAVNFPVLKIDTVGRKDPTFEIVNPPAGRDAVGQGIKNATKEPARLEITLGDKVLYDSGLYEKGTSGLTIKVRGNTSASSALNPPPPHELANKFPYKLKLQKKADLLFHDGGQQEKAYKSKDWNLLASSRTINSPIGFYLNYLMGFDWTPGWRFVNLILNNKYRGLYILVESVEPDANRIAVSDDGYLAELDAYWWNEDVYVKTPKCPKYMGYTFKYPDAEDITDEQVAYFKDTMTKVEEAIIEKGTYPELIETASWATWVLGHDILGSKDGAGVNQYLKKLDSSEGSRVAYALLWDFDDLRYDANNWSTVHNITSAGYFPYLMESKNRTFNTAYWAKWAEMRGLIPSILTMLNDWRTDGTSVAYDQSRALETGNVFYNFDSQYQVFKDWFEARIKWIDKQFAAGKMPVDSTIWNALSALSGDAAWQKLMASEAFVKRFGSNFLRAALSPTGKCGLDGKPLYVWSEFLAKTNPLDPNDIPGKKRPFAVFIR